jgi:hypothetical protein
LTNIAPSETDHTLAPARTTGAATPAATPLGNQTTGSSASGPSLPAATPIAEYLRDRFAQRFERISYIKTLACGTAYRHITEEKQVNAICQALNLNLNQRHFAPVTTEGREVAYDDVVRAAGFNSNTFAATRTAVNKAREARRRLSRYFNNRTQGTVLAVAEEEQLANILRELDVLLRESDIAEEHLTDLVGLEGVAINMSYETFKANVKVVLDALPQ